MKNKKQQNEKNITFYRKNVQPSPKRITFCKQLERKRSHFETTQRPEEEKEKQQQQRHAKGLSKGKLKEKNLGVKNHYVL